MILHKIIACRRSRKKIEKVCEKMGLNNFRYRGNFYSRFLYFFKRHYLVFASTDETVADSVPFTRDENKFSQGKTLCLVGFLLNFFGGFFLAFPLSIIGLVKVFNNEPEDHPATAYKVLGIIGLIPLILVAVIFTIYMFRYVI